MSVLRIDAIEDLGLARQVAQLLERENDRLHARVEALLRENASLRGTDGNKQLEIELLQLQEQMKALQHRMFGASSERRAREAEQAGDKNKPAPPDGPRVQKKLAFEEELHELPESGRTCTKCGKPVIVCGGETEDHEEIDVVQRRFVLKRHKRKKYNCECGATKLAPVPARLPGGGRYSLDFAIEVAFEKWCAHSPLERQVRIMLGQGLDISSNTLWEQAERLARVLTPTYLALRDYVVCSDLVHADETPWYMLNKGRSKWWVWSISRHDAVFYRVDSSRSADVIVEMLKGFEGALMVDGYAAYGAARKSLSNKVALAICWSHARRGFVEAEPSYPECTPAIELIGELFLIERELPAWQVIEDPVLRNAQLQYVREVRASKSAPLVEKLRTWASEQSALPQSKLGEALTYLKNQWQGLTLSLDDPRVPLSNNPAERTLRGVVVGRKCSECSNELGHVLVATEFAEPLLSFADAERDPAPDHGCITPAPDAVLNAADRAVQILDRIGRGKGALQCLGEAEVLERERFVEALLERCRSPRVFGFEANDELHEAPLGDCLRRALVRVAHRLVDAGMQLLGKLRKNVAALVLLAALDEQAVAKRVADGLAQGPCFRRPRTGTHAAGRARPPASVQLVRAVVIAAASGYGDGKPMFCARTCTSVPRRWVRGAFYARFGEALENVMKAVSELALR